MNKAYMFLAALIFLVSCSYQPTYEYCSAQGECEIRAITQITLPSAETDEICYQGKCEDVPKNRLLLKGGTDKKSCGDAPYLESDYVDNYWGANGVIDECEMPPKSEMTFLQKQHDQSVRVHSGDIQIKMRAFSYKPSALQVFVASGGNTPDSWTYCGNVDSIQGWSTKYIICSGENLRFIKLISADWNEKSIFLDYIEVLVA